MRLNAEIPFPAGPIGSAPPEYHYLRKTMPIVQVRLRDGTPVWLMTKYDDIKFVLSDRRFSRSLAAKLPGTGFGRSGDIGPFQSLVNKDGREHANLRKLVASDFDRNIVQRHSDFIEETSIQLLTAMQSDGNNADLVEEYSIPLASKTICKVMGIDWTKWMASIEDGALRRIMSRNDGAGNSVDTRKSLVRKLSCYLQDWNYLPDTVGHKLVIALNAKQISEIEFCDYILSLLIAGHEGVATALTKAVVLLLKHPNQLNALKSNPDMFDRAAEEAVRFYASSNESVLRVASENIEISNITILKGDIVMTPAVAANRDPTRFKNGDNFDYLRNFSGHLGFGAGSHYCIGASLARLELKIGLQTLFKFLPTLSIRDDVNNLFDTSEFLLKFPFLNVDW